MRKVSKINAALVSALAMAGILNSVPSGASSLAYDDFTWLLSSPLRKHLSGAAETSLLAKSGLLRLSLPSTPDPLAARRQPSPGGDIRINRPGEGEAAPNCNIQNEVHIARSGKQLVAGWNDSGECDYLVRSTGISIAGYGWSEDGGETWHDGGVITPADGGNVWGDPALAVDAAGNFYYAVLYDSADMAGRIGVARSRDGGKTWSEPVVASGNVSDGPGFHDKEWIAVDTTASRYGGNIYVVWTAFADDIHVWLSRSVNGGKSYQKPIKLGKQALHEGTGVQVAVGPQGEVYVVWNSLSHHLWFTKSVNGGVTFAPPREIAQLQQIGHYQPDCFRNALDGHIRISEYPSLAVDVSRSKYRGNIYVAVPSRGEGTDEADMFFLSSADGGKSWTPLLKINDDETANDNFHPQVAVDPRSTVMVSWYDRRLGDESVRTNHLIDVFAAYSTDGGNTFSENLRVTDVSFPPAQTQPNTGLFAQCYMGEYNGMVAGEAAEFFLNWGDNRDTTLGFPDPNVYFDRVRI